MMKPVIKLCFLIMIVLAACKPYETFHYDVLRPANYTVPPVIKSVVLVDNSLPYYPDQAHYANVEGKIIALDTVVVDTFATAILNELKRELEYRQFFDTVYIDTIKFQSAEMSQLSSNELREFSERFNADAVLSLDVARYGTLVEVQDMGVELFATMEVKGVLLWKMYDLYDLNTTPIIKDVQRDTLFWSSVNEEIGVAVGLLPSIKDATIELGSYLGATFADELIPRWDNVERKLFLSGSPMFVSAAEWYSKNNREEAEKLWGYIYQHGSNKDKGKAANNIAVSMEERGELTIAVEWAYKSYQAFKEANNVEAGMAQILYQDLVHRQRDEKKLIEQIGGAYE